MPIQDAETVKERILSLIRVRGPCLPIHISKGLNMSIIFSSAFLSELINEKRLKMSNMRVGSSPIFYLEEQEPQLEIYSEHLKGKEREAYFLLKERKFLEDSSQPPPIRVALRAIKDFAKPFHYKGLTIWRFFTSDESEFNKVEEIVKSPITQEIKRDVDRIEKEVEKIVLVSPEIEREKFSEIEKEISDNELNENNPRKKQEQKEKPKKLKTKKAKKQNDKFFNRVKEYLNQKEIELLDIEDFSKSEIVLRVKQNKKEILIIAFNKKKMTDKDIINAYKKAQKLEMPYSIISLGETPKKLNDLVEASKALSGMEKLG